MEKLTVSRPIIVEGKYDKIALSSVLHATVLTTDGFGLFRQKEKVALLRRLAGDLGVIVLTDSDGGGRQIRSFLSGILPKEKVTHLFIPRIEGKERRKKKGGKAGTLGVEGMEPELLRELFLPFSDGAAPKPAGGITKEEAERLHLEMWVCVHGIASMVATSFLTLPWELISDMLTDVYQGIRTRVGGKKE